MLGSNEGSDDALLDLSLSREVPPLDLNLDQARTVVCENLDTTGCKIGRQALMTPSVGSKAVVTLSRTTSYVTSPVKLSR